MEICKRLPQEPSGQEDKNRGDIAGVKEIGGIVMGETMNMQFTEGFVQDIKRLYELTRSGKDGVKVHLPLEEGKDVTVDFIFLSNEVKCDV